jgi:hypothetical protein
MSGPRRLYVRRLAGQPKQSLILRRGPALKGDGTRTTVSRWWLESWARCDWSELPAEVVAAQQLQLWSDERGGLVPTTTVVSLDISCAAGVTVLDHGDAEYARNADGFPNFVSEKFRPHVQVPRDAKDSGYHRDGKHLWWARGGAYVGGRSDAEFWPLTKQPIRCG